MGNKRSLNVVPVNGFTDWGGVYAPSSAILDLDTNIVTLSGLLKTPATVPADNTVIAQIKDYSTTEYMGPEYTEILKGIGYGGANVRLDIKANGDIVYRTDCDDLVANQWISLSGLSYETGLTFRLVTHAVLDDTVQWAVTGLADYEAQLLSVRGPSWAPHPDFTKQIVIYTTFGEEVWLVKQADYDAFTLLSEAGYGYTTTHNSETVNVINIAPKALDSFRVYSPTFKDITNLFNLNNVSGISLYVVPNTGAEAGHRGLGHGEKIKAKYIKVSYNGGTSTIYWGDTVSSYGWVDTHAIAKGGVLDTFFPKPY